MIEINEEVMLQTCNLSTALVRNVNDNFVSVSFDILDNGEIQVKFILAVVTVVEEDYIIDAIAEFSALQENDIVRKPVIEIIGMGSPLTHSIYERDNMN